MKKERAGLGKIAKPSKGILYALLGFASIVIVLGLLHAQTFLNGGQSRPPDSFVQVAAESQGLAQVAPEDLPRGGTYWWVMPNGCAVPTPFLPRDLNGPVYQITDVQFLVDTTGGQVALNSHPSALHRQTTANTVATVIAAHADAVVNLINQIQAREYARQVRTMALAMGIPMLGGGGDSSGGGDGGGVLPSGSAFTFDKSGLWLGGPIVSNGVSYLNLNNATNQVYAILTTTNLLGSWQVETEVWPTNGVVMPFTAQNADRPILFFRAKDWTGVTENGNTTPDWWLWQYFGTTALSDTNLDAAGNTLVSDYTNNLAPAVFSYTGVEVANNNVNASAVPVQLDVAGNPYYVAVLVDDTNYNNAVWNTYSSANVTVNLGSTEGWHDVWIGLRGHADAPNAAVWQWQRLKLTFTPPSLVITGPTNGTVTQPLIQLTGYSPKALSSISYDLNNAAGVVTNQQVLVVNQDYDTTTWEFTTNTFQGFDIPLTNGVNTFTLHATDLAGNVTTLVTNFTLDYSTKTNPPGVQLLWPVDGVEICGNNIVCRGQVADPTVTVTAQWVDANAQTNTVGSLVGRDGLFYTDNLTLAAGTNHLSFTVTDAVGNITTTNITVVMSDLGLTLNPVVAGQAVVTGTIADDSYTIYVNGVTATNNGDGTWTALITPISGTGGAVVVNAVKAGGDPSLQQVVLPPQGVYMDVSHSKESDNYWGNDFQQDESAWSDNAGGSASEQSSDGVNNFSTGIIWPTSPWPAAVPLGVLWVTNNGQYLYHTMRPAGLSFYYDHAIVKAKDAGTGSSFTETVDGALKFATGGPLGSIARRLYQFSGSVTVHHNPMPDLDEVPWSTPPDDETVADERVNLGGLGHLDANGKVYVWLADNARVDVTPTIKGAKDYSFPQPSYQVINLTHLTEHPALTDTNRARLNLGVGEEVDLSGMPDGTTWSASAGGISTNVYGTIVFTAPSHATNATVSATVSNQTLQVAFVVKEPSGVDHAINKNIIHYAKNANAVGMDNYVWIAPTSVSFYRVELIEIPGPATGVSGYWASTNYSGDLSHHPNTNWLSLSEDNLWPGGGYDEATDPANAPPWYDGTFQWDIPVGWRVIGMSATNSISQWHQYFTIYPNGTETIEKFGLKVTRTTNDDITITSGR